MNTHTPAEDAQDYAAPAITRRQRVVALLVPADGFTSDTKEVN